MLRRTTLRCCNLLSQCPVEAALVALRLEQNASLARVKEKYRKMAMRLHPDRGGDVEAFNRLKAHYDVLCGSMDTQHKAYYDESYANAVLLRLKRCIREADKELYTSTYHEVVDSSWMLRSTPLLYSVIDGAVLMHPPSLDHSRCCLHAVVVWEGHNKCNAPFEMFNAVLMPYCDFTPATPEEGVALTECVTFIAEEMQRRGIDTENDSWTYAFPGLSNGSAW